MNTSNVTIKSYLPPEKRERSKLQQVKDKHRSFTQTNKQGIPKNLNELKLIKYRDHAITFLNQYTNIDKKTTKSKYCKSNHISHNSLNTGLKLLGYKTSIPLRGSSTLSCIKPDQSRPVETKPDQSRPIGTKRKKQNLIQAGKIHTELHSASSLMKNFSEDEEITEMIDNRLTNLSLVNGSDT